MILDTIAAATSAPIFNTALAGTIESAVNEALFAQGSFAEPSEIGSPTEVGVGDSLDIEA